MQPLPRQHEDWNTRSGRKKKEDGRRRIKKEEEGAQKTRREGRQKRRRKRERKKRKKETKKVNPSQIPSECMAELVFMSSAQFIPVTIIVQTLPALSLLRHIAMQSTGRTRVREVVAGVAFPKPAQATPYVQLAPAESTGTASPTAAPAVRFQSELERY